MIAAREKYYIFLTLFFTGAAIMVIELMGTRVVGPYYGVSLYVWSSLISVTLVALSVGYWLGGKVADRALDVGEQKEVKREQAMRATRLMYRLILAAGVSIILVPALATTVLKATTPLGIKAGALVSTFILFTVPLVILGMITPYAIKVLTDKLKVVGTTAGNLFAISTVGSFMGTIMTGFVFIPNMGTKKVLYVQAALLLGIWVVWELMEKKYAASLLALPLVGFCLASVLTTEKLAEAGGFKVVDKTTSFYGDIKVIDKGVKRWLAINNTADTGIRKDTGFSLMPYAYYMEIVNRMRPGASDALVIGLGGGSITQRLTRNYGLSVDSVEIDPRVISLARKHFGLKSTDGDVHEMDGRAFVSSTQKKYDFVLMDAFGADAPPFHMYSREAFGEIKGILKPRGIYAVNTHGFREGEGARLPASVYATLEEVFPHVRAFHTYSTSEEIGNAILLASEEPLEVDAPLTGCEIPGVCDLFNEMLANEIHDFGVVGSVITDDFNPVDAWSVDNSVVIRKKVQEFLPAEVLAF
jgi:spermidine synthase